MHLKCMSTQRIGEKFVIASTIYARVLQWPNNTWMAKIHENLGWVHISKGFRENETL